MLPSGHIGGKGGQDQYEWWCHVTDPIMAVVINTIIDHHDHDQDQHHDQINVGQSKVVTKVRRPTVRSLIPSELPLVTKSEVNADKVKGLDMKNASKM